MNNFLKEHPAVCLTLAYICVSLSSYYYENQFYSYFGINIALYSEPEDYFFSWVRNEELVSTLIAVFIAAFLFSRVIKYYLYAFSEAEVGKWRDLFKHILLVITICAIFYIASEYGVSNTLNYFGIPAKQNIETIINSTLLISFIIIFLSNFLPLFPSLRDKIKESKNSIYYLIALYIPLTGVLIFDSATQHAEEFFEYKLGKYLVSMKRPSEVLGNEHSYHLIGVTSRYHIFYVPDSDIKTVFIQNDNISKLSKTFDQTTNSANGTSTQSL